MKQKYIQKKYQNAINGSKKIPYALAKVKKSNSKVKEQSI